MNLIEISNVNNQSTSNINMIIQSIQQFIPEWSLAIILITYFLFIGNKTHPFLREFLINDPSIQHPFTKFEQVNDTTCILISSLIPLISITLVLLYQNNFQPQKILQSKQRLIKFQLSILGLILTLSITGTITVFLKNLIARPRPDFIDRCQPDPSKLTSKLLYTIDICTRPDKELILEGLRSTPSGHSSISFSGMTYLTLFLCSQWRVFSNRTRLHCLFCAGMPIFIAVWIALSRTQDYRHHFGDVTMGGMIGVVVSWGCFRKIFPSVVDENCDQVCYLKENENILPLYNTSHE